MAADTNLTLTARMPIENHQTPGQFGVTSRFSGGVIVVTYNGNQGAETVYLRHPGDSLTLDMLNIDALSVEAKLADLVTDAYPADVLILQTTTHSAVLTAAPYITILQGGNQAFHADAEVAAGAGGTTTVYTPPVGYRAVITSVFITSDAATRYGLVDGTDVAGNRIIIGRQIGSVARFLGDPDGFQQAATNTAIVLVYGASGNFDVAIDGYIRQG